MARISCPICNGTLEIPDDAIAGELFEHPDCGAQLELVIDRDGSFKLDLAEEVAEDWGE